VETESSSYIVDTFFNRVKEYYPGYVIHNNTLYEVEWSDVSATRLSRDGLYKRNPIIIHQDNLDGYLVPYVVDQITQGEKTLSRIGYVKIEDVNFASQAADLQLVIPPFYEEGHLFVDGIAAVKRNGKWGYINEKGETISDCIYDEVKDFSEGFAAVYIYETVPDIKGAAPLRIDKWAIIDNTGELVTDFKFKDIGPFSDGVALVAYSNSMSGFVDTKGEPTGVGTVPSSFIYNLSEGLRLISNSGYYYYNHLGEVAINKRFAEAKSFSNGLAAVKNSFNEVGLH